MGALATTGCGDSASNTGGTGGGGTTSSTTGATSGTGTGSSSSSGTGGGGDTGPITAPDDTWTYVPFSGSKCMNGTSTGIGINKHPGSKDVVIFMQGGNACFNATSCAITAHKNGYGPTDFDMEKTSILDTKTLFSRTATSNPLKDWNYVYIPYCTGDLHFGDNDTMVGGQMRTFHGYNNVELYLQRVVATYPDAQRVIVTGVSAGGFGAALNYAHVSEKFPNVQVMLLDDSGPPFEAPAAPACLQKKFMDTWGYDKTLPTACGATCKPADGAFLPPYVSYVLNTYPNSRKGLISSTEDATISQFLGFGDNDCSGIDSVIPGPFTGAQYTAGLVDIRDVEFAGHANIHTFFIDGVNNVNTTMMDKTQHVWLNEDPSMVYSHDTVLLDWLNQMLTGDAAWANVGGP
jgi:hypothetical protein